MAIRLQSQVWLVAGLALLLSMGHARARTFQNLGFESATVVPVSGNRVEFGSAFPSWTCTVGGIQQTSALYDAVDYMTAGVTLIDHAWSHPDWVIDGNYTAILQGGSLNPIGPSLSTTLSQTALVPTTAESLRFNCRSYFAPSNAFGLVVALDGQWLSLIMLGTGNDYTTYGADIRDWANQTVNLGFTAMATEPHTSINYISLDSIQFSDLPIPEPSTLGLSAVGALLLGWRGLGQRRCQRN